MLNIKYKVNGINKRYQMKNQEKKTSIQREGKQAHPTTIKYQRSEKRTLRAFPTLVASLMIQHVLIFSSLEHAVVYLAGGINCLPFIFSSVGSTSNIANTSLIIRKH